MPTLLAVNNYYYYRGGAETVFLEHNHIFEKRGWDVVPFAMKHSRNLPSAWDKHFVDELEFGKDYSLPEKVTRALRVLYSFQSKRNLRELLNKVRPDICHAHNIYHHISPSILGTLKQHGVPIVLSLHDLKIACPAYNMLTHDGICERCRGGRIYNVVLHRCIKNSVMLSTLVMMEAVLHGLLGTYRNCVSRFVVPSRFYLHKFIEWGMQAEMFRYVPNFVDVANYEPRYEPGDRIIYVGRLSREKGLHTLIRAAAAVRCSISIVGTGPELASLQRLALQLGADVEFLGYLSGKSLHQAVQMARALVLPSECYENAPMCVLEAYALGKPAIGARIGGIPEIILQNETGFHFESGDVSSLAQVLDRVRSSPPADLEHMGRSGRSLAEREFSAESYGERMLDVYRELGVPKLQTL